jgi:hypothetical protein
MASTVSTPYHDEDDYMCNVDSGGEEIAFNHKFSLQTLSLSQHERSRSDIQSLLS